MIKKLSTDDQLTPPDARHSTMLRLLPACSVSLATLPLVAMGHLI
jgi:hypothetical protein